MRRNSPRSGTAADDEFLIEHPDGAEAGVGRGEHGPQRTIHALAPLRQLPSTDRDLDHLGADLGRRCLCRAELLEQIRCRPALRPAGVRRRRGQDHGACILQRRFRHRH
jgi:hypothetical protein